MKNMHRVKSNFLQPIVAV